MSVLGDLWNMLPKEVKILAAIALFLYAGSAILNAIVFLWNLTIVSGMNAVNGCYTGEPAACVPASDGIYIFGINFTDYWIITALIFLPAMALFAIKWYGAVMR